MKKTKYRRENLYNVLFFYKDAAGIYRALKLHNVEVDRTVSWNNTVAYVRSRHPNVEYANVYGGQTRQFKKRINLKQC